MYGQAADSRITPAGSSSWEGPRKMPIRYWSKHCVSDGPTMKVATTDNKNLVRFKVASSRSASPSSRHPMEQGRQPTNRSPGPEQKPMATLNIAVSEYGAHLSPHLPATEPQQRPPRSANSQVASYSYQRSRPKLPAQSGGKNFKQQGCLGWAD